MGKESTKTVSSIDLLILFSLHGKIHHLNLLVKDKKDWDARERERERWSEGEKERWHVYDDDRRLLAAVSTATGADSSSSEPRKGDKEKEEQGVMGAHVTMATRTQTSFKRREGKKKKRHYFAQSEGVDFLKTLPGEFQLVRRVKGADMDWGTDLWDQGDVIDKHTQAGLDLVERYIKFVKERTELEQNYAKQLRSLSKKYAKKGSKDDQDCRFSNHAALQEILNELNDYAGQRELIGENMMTNICVDLIKFLQDLKQDRKAHLSDAKRAQQNLESSFKQLESTKRRFAKEWAEAEKATQQAEKTENDANATKIDVDKAKQHAHARTHTAEECRNDYAAQLQKYNKEQNYYYYTEIPQIFNKLQDLDERRIRRLADGYCQFSDLEKKVQPIISKCLDGISAAGAKVDAKQDSVLLVEQHKSGFERPSDVDFEDYTQGIKAASSDSSLNLPKFRSKLWPISRKHKPPPAEDFSHLPPEQRKKKLQAKIHDVFKKLHMEQETSEALEKMKGVYEQNANLGDPSTLEPKIAETVHNMGYLRGEIAKYETWLSEAVGGDECANAINNNNNSHHAPNTVVTPEKQQNIYTEFDDDFDEFSQCTALYSFEGNSEGTISVTDGELLSVMEEDKGDGWMRVLRANGEEGFIPSSYVKLSS